ncbi:D-2-hydroxyacid dehydrogenase [Alteromonas aestuariivivens]|uniref:D-2-hydroxyacid dehydrogenase n=1 Tax=Alteromonas aestuariivivens TaxID=1938339 RepID=A0A3D8M514_9ALTE|nr:D-2-hydroxyacid dehydrogenase [Alteromonas aestuariivivens]RDV24823.1 D-2-hydroxyacid dehydrogenase [Alteromonas aestuariivivens]
MKAVLLDADTLKPDDLDLTALTDLPIDLTVYPVTRPGETLARISDAKIVLTNKVVLNSELLSQASECRYIGVLATGTNNVDMNYCRENQIAVRNVEGYGTDSVAQHALMLMLNLATRFVNYHTDVQAGAWAQSPFFCLLEHPVIELAGKHLVIVGHGTLGARFAELARALGMQVTVSARPGAIGDTRPSLDSLLPEADVVSLHCPLTEHTRHLINAPRLAMMKPSALLINTARGGLVDEMALRRALENGSIGGAGLDVLSEEPPAADHPLLVKPLPNLIITPHCAWAARESRQRMVSIAARHIRDFLNCT